MCRRHNFFWKREIFGREKRGVAIIQDSDHFKQIKEIDIIESILLAQADSKHAFSLSGI